MPPVQVQVGTVEYLHYMVKALALGREFFLIFIVLPHVDVSNTSDWKILVPIYRDTMRMSIAAPFADIGKAFYSAVAVCINCNRGTVVPPILLFCL